MDAVKLLMDDHKKVRDLFRQFEKARTAWMTSRAPRGQPPAPT